VDALYSGYLSNTQSSQEQESTFLFKSDYQTIRSAGVVARIDLPVADIRNSNSAFKAQLDQAFSKAKQQGQSNPILVGAIPFDMSQPSRLMVPQWWGSSHVGDFSAQGLDDTKTDLAVLSSRSIPGFTGFTDGVAKAIESFKLGQLDKVVLSRLLEVELDKVPNHNQIMAKIMAQNPSAFHFRVPIEGGVLMGASPELLVRKQDGRLFSNPLAGSAKRSHIKKEDAAARASLVASEKDHYEHQLVIDVMRQQLVDECTHIDIPDTPSVINTPTMWHLSSKIEGILKDPKISALELACLIHPTPAMCGSPTKLARQAIADIEPHERGYFSGMVGWCDSQGNGEWAVTIRCSTIQGSTVRLFAGAGVVESSVPESEWAETRAKFTTMLNAFGINEEIV